MPDVTGETIEESGIIETIVAIPGITEIIDEGITVMTDGQDGTKSETVYASALQRSSRRRRY
jgi:hypothetical protein